MSVVNESWTTARDYSHPPQRVFAAWADPVVKARWFDLSEAAEATYEAEYRDIVEGERIVSTYEIRVDQRRVSVSVATVTFEPTATGTHLTYVEQGAFLDGLDSAASRRLGVATQLDRLSAVLAGTR